MENAHQYSYLRQLMKLIFRQILNILASHKLPQAGLQEHLSTTFSGSA